MAAPVCLSSAHGAGAEKGAHTQPVQSQCRALFRVALAWKSMRNDGAPCFSDGTGPPRRAGFGNGPIKVPLCRLMDPNLNWQLISSSTPTSRPGAEVEKLAGRSKTLPSPASGGSPAGGNVVAQGESHRAPLSKINWRYAGQAVAAHGVSSHRLHFVVGTQLALPAVEYMQAVHSLCWATIMHRHGCTTCTPFYLTVVRCYSKHIPYIYPQVKLQGCSLN